MSLVEKCWMVTSKISVIALLMICLLYTSRELRVLAEM